MGSAKVDLAPLLVAGFDEVCGWYTVKDFKGEAQGTFPCPPHTHDAIVPVRRLIIGVWGFAILLSSPR